jgi:hypothetical protein
MNTVRTNPIFIVGLPRSGTTLLANLMIARSDILCVNDLYYVQAVASVDGFTDSLGAEKAAHLRDYLFTIVTRVAKNNPNLDLQQDTLEAVRDDIGDVAGLDWATLMDRTLTGVAHALGKRRWADKTPQNFHHIEKIRTAFPGAQFIFMLRDPRQVLASFKYADSGGHDVRRYHPVAYSYYWLVAARRYLALRGSDDVCALPYEALVTDLEQTMLDLSAFLSDEFGPQAKVTADGSYSSFKGGRRKSINVTEEWICEHICGSVMSALGYQLQQPRPSWRDLPSVAQTTARFAAFQASRFINSRDDRARILTLLRGAK